MRGFCMALSNIAATGALFYPYFLHRLTVYWVARRDPDSPITLFSFALDSFALALLFFGCFISMFSFRPPDFSIAFLYAAGASGLVGWVVILFLAYKNLSLIHI